MCKKDIRRLSHDRMPTYKQVVDMLVLLFDSKFVDLGFFFADRDLHLVGHQVAANNSSKNGASCSKRWRKDPVTGKLVQTIAELDEVVSKKPAASNFTPESMKAAGEIAEPFRFLENFHFFIFSSLLT